MRDAKQTCETPRYPEYEPDALFRCSNCGRKFERRNCHTHRGLLACPNCIHLKWTLSFTGEHQPREDDHE